MPRPRHRPAIVPWLQRPLLAAPVLATLAQLVLAAVAAAASGGGDFPIRR